VVLASFVHGHGPKGSANRGPHSHLRFQYLPLPTISKYDGNLRVGAIRRVMISAPVGCEDRIDFIRKRLIGRELIWQNETVGILNLASQTDWVSRQYTGCAYEWCSVSPVILDGFDDHNPNKTRRLIRKALANTGTSIDTEFDWQPFGYLAGVEPARAFFRPDKLNGILAHLKIRFAHPVCVPIVLGAGRFRGFGLMAIHNEETDIQVLPNSEKPEQNSIGQSS